MAQDLRKSQSNLTQTSQLGNDSGTLRRRRESQTLFPSHEDLFRMSPFHLMRHFSDEMDRMWSGYGRGERHGNDLSSWRPVVDVRERNGQLEVQADLPGVNEQDVKVGIENDMLIIQGERHREEERDEDGWYRAERSYGSFHRVIPLPEGAQADQANATFKSGVLCITMPLSKKQQNMRQIPIASSSTNSSSASSSTQTGTNKTDQKPSQTEQTSRAGGA